MNRKLREFVLRYRLLRIVRAWLQSLPFLSGKPPLEEQSWGEAMPDSHFLVIRRDENGVGLFSYFITVLGWLRFAESHGMIPVVDMQNDKNIYQDRTSGRRENSWSFYFDQPCHYNLTDIKDARNVTVARGFLPDAGFLPIVWDQKTPMQLSEVDSWRRLVSRYIRIRHNALKPFFNADFEQAIRSKEGVLGVLARGTDYAKLRPEGHPVQPAAEEIFEQISHLEKVEGWRFSYIYLVTEDREIEEKFYTQYAHRLIVAKQGTIAYKSGYLSKCADVAHNRIRGAAYLKAIYDLSRCDYLVGGRTSGSLGAVLLTSGFKGQYLFDKGVY